MKKIQEDRPRAEYKIYLGYVEDISRLSDSLSKTLAISISTLVLTSFLTIVTFLLHDWLFIVFFLLSILMLLQVLLTFSDTTDSKWYYESLPYSFEREEFDSIKAKLEATLDEAK